MIGIGGAGMRNVARLLVARGLGVSGSDLKDSQHLKDLRELGVEATVGHDPGALGDAQVVVVSSAIGDRNVELVAAWERGLAVWKRQQALAALARGRRTVAVAGTHGKTTTTSMLATILEDVGLEPTYLIGGDLNESGSGAAAGSGDLFVFEADESDGSHLLMMPWTGIITNIEPDHLDFYSGGLPEIEASFAEFATGVENLVVWAEDPAIERALASSGREAITYGVAVGDLRVEVERLGADGATGSLHLPGGGVVPLSLSVDGVHNLLNAAAAVATAELAGVDPIGAAEALGSFRGVHRRFEVRGAARGAVFIDDYGHTPTEMAVTIASARRRSPRRLVALVQPHRYGRVQAMWRELGASVTGADMVIVTDVYGADQEPIPGVTGKLVVDGVQDAAPGLRTVYLPHRRDVVDLLDQEVREGDLVLTMGCGDVWMLADAALERKGGDDV
jgi:UDP-N-acetylmuramate--alanine ligase